MHVYTIKDKKIAIFWSPRCGHRSLTRLLRMWNYPYLFTTTHLWKRDLEEYTWVKEKEKIHREFLKKINKDDLIGYKKLVLIRDPWKRFCSFWRWGIDHNFLPPKITPERYINEFNRSREEFNNEHHSMPQWSQASCLLSGDEEYFDILNFDVFAKRLAELTGNFYYTKHEDGFNIELQGKIGPDIHNKEIKISKPVNFSKLYGIDEICYQDPLKYFEIKRK